MAPENTDCSEVDEEDEEANEENKAKVVNAKEEEVWDKEDKIDFSKQVLIADVEYE